MPILRNQHGFTLIEMLMVIGLSMVILAASILYIRSVYRAHLINQAEELILQVITAARAYQSPPARINVVPRQFNGITTTWVAGTGQIPQLFIKQNTQTDSQTNKTTISLAITSPWSDESSIEVAGGSQSGFDVGTPGSNDDDTYIYIKVMHLPNYACMTLASRLIGELGTSVYNNRVLLTPTYTACDKIDDEEGPYVLRVATNPNLY